MAEKRDIRRGVVTGLTIGVGLVIVKTCEAALKEKIGEWPAFGVGLIVALAVSLVMTGLVYRFWKLPD